MFNSASLVGAAVLLVALFGRAADVVPLDQGDHGPAPALEPGSSTTRAFAVQIPADVTVGTVIPALVVAGGAALMSEPRGEWVGEAQQQLGPIGLTACGLFAAGSFLLLNEILCPAAKTPKERDDCGRWANYGIAGVTLLCALPF